MEKNHFEKIAAEAIMLEMKMHEIYSLFQTIFPEDKDFWKKIASEEKSHAEIIRKITPFFSLEEVNIEEVIILSVDSIRNEMKNIDEKIEYFKANPNRKEAFEKAYEIENNASEIHYQTFLDKNDDSKLSKVFKILNGNDKDHAERINTYMNKISYE